MRSLILTCLLTGTAFAQSYNALGDAQLQAYLEQALEQNPQARQAFAQYQAALAKLPQAAALPDPTLAVTQYVRTPETRVGPQTTMLSVSQKIPFFGKRGDREGVASKEAEMHRHRYEAVRDEIIRQVKQAYYQLAYVDQVTIITGDDLSLLEQYETLAQARYQQGVGLQQSVVKLQAEITRVQTKLVELRSHRGQLASNLNTLLDQPPATSVSAVLIPNPPPVSLDYTALERAARDNRPEVQEAFLGIERDEKRYQLARRNRWPDVTLGATFANVLARRDLAGVLNPPSQNGKNIYGVSASVNLPIWKDKYDAAIVEATEAETASREGYRNAVNSAEGQIHSIGFRLESLEDQIRLFTGTLIPQAEQALRTTEAAYSTGTLGVLDLLDSERMLIQVRLGLAQYRSDLLQAMADMERAIGAPFPEVTP